jgi:hypothetical protein
LNAVHFFQDRSSKKRARNEEAMVVVTAEISARHVSLNLFAANPFLVRTALHATAKRLPIPSPCRATAC